MNIADNKYQGQYTNSGDSTDKNHGSYKRTGQMDDKANDNGCHNTGQIASKAENTAGQSERILRSDIANSTPDDSRHALSKERKGHDGNDDIQGIEIVGSHDRHRTNEAAGNRQFTGFR